eukprot:31450-Pelagococcus_subviridis.AAC.19
MTSVWSTPSGDGIAAGEGARRVEARSRVRGGRKGSRALALFRGVCFGLSVRETTEHSAEPGGGSQMSSVGPARAPGGTS